MSLLSNSLFLDSEYKADCEYKINYLNVIDNKTNQDSITIENTSTDEDSTIDSKEELADVFKGLETRIITSENSRPTFTDGMILYTTKKISPDTYKILLEIDNSPLSNTETVN